ncbi:tRNA (adenosine(37)-N6)-threonylcarbamoyltransferase complex dimerization subunit type 1 TsaB [Pantoea sp. Nvir]|uniref:tRNA (adenosine(37)-N6)-threonylcarbamoyltransferase complex dimerization subunit type 1 TsaB n=1 Tax=Pantoea sp. Nvir TaxID=2576760 RepID=UPI00135AD1E1|nr:tRNA (adenosine(37)-N6)-threonylcarbamoyltransferase complex dimerization subunit type 1 TsaB [Pantoea sp. Nvir]MXP66675.1 tRNA (adenosine(37)-N6)-threonylcarbamoyltransferase complex dimerization subunit type 1 TsaB [Pantoea sp. Nvir]CAJ0991875.1 tRNA threonylcarbamoyladenosine biosynthesis protein TsaB [Pantoea sp. Nvir]
MCFRILALDTATEACSAALNNKQQVSACFEITPREHAQRILPLIDGLLHAQNLDLAELDVLAFGRGPGSFTGVRIGIGIAQGLALGARLPMIGISTLVTLAQGAYRLQGATRVLSAVNARMGEVYWAEYQRDEQGFWQGEMSESIFSIKTALCRMQSLEGEWFIAGSGWQVWPSQLHKEHSLILKASGVELPTAEDMLPLAQQMWQHGKTVSPEEASPSYLRNKVACKKNLRRESLLNLVQ